MGLGRKTDYATVRRGDRGPKLDPGSCGRIFDGPVGGVRAGDYFGVVADLAIPSLWVSAFGRPEGEERPVNVIPGEPCRGPRPCPFVRYETLIGAARIGGDR